MALFNNEAEFKDHNPGATVLASSSLSPSGVEYSDFYDTGYVVFSDGVAVTLAAIYNYVNGGDGFVFISSDGYDGPGDESSPADILVNGFLDTSPTDLGTYDDLELTRDMLGADSLLGSVTSADGLVYNFVQEIDLW